LSCSPRVWSNKSCPARLGYGQTKVVLLASGMVKQMTVKLLFAA
jgi:hypothetical protein